MKTYYFKKTVLFGAGYPQIQTTNSGLFAVTGTNKEIREFFEEHETTHAKFEQLDGRHISKDDRIFIYWNYRYELSKEKRISNYLLY